MMTVRVDDKLFGFVWAVTSGEGIVVIGCEVDCT